MSEAAQAKALDKRRRADTYPLSFEGSRFSERSKDMPPGEGKKSGSLKP